MKEEAFEVYETTGMERAGSYWQPKGSVEAFMSMDQDQGEQSEVSMDIVSK